MDILLKNHYFTIKSYYSSKTNILLYLYYIYWEQARGSKKELRIIAARTAISHPTGLRR